MQKACCTYTTAVACTEQPVCQQVPCQCNLGTSACKHLMVINWVYLCRRSKGHRLCCPVCSQMPLFLESSWVLGIPGKLESCLLVVIRFLIIHLHNTWVTPLAKPDMPLYTYEVCPADTFVQGQAACLRHPSLDAKRGVFVLGSSMQCARTTAYQVEQEFALVPVRSRCQ